MVRCGFDAFEPNDGCDAGGLGQGGAPLPPRLSARRRQRGNGRVRGKGQLMAYDQTATEVKPCAAAAADALAARLDAELRDAHPLTVLRRAYETFGDKLALVSLVRRGVGGAAAPGQPGRPRTSRCCSSTPACCLARPWTTARRWPPSWA